MSDGNYTTVGLSSLQPTRYCKVCSKLIMEPDQNYAINPDYVCRCPRDSEPHGWKEVQREVAGTSSERAELQVFLGAPIEVPVNVNQAQVLVVRMFESLQRDVEQLRKWLDPTSDTTGVHSEFNYLTSMCAKTSDKVSDVADRLDIHKLSLEGIQGLLVEIQATVPLMLGSLENRIMEQRSQLLDNQTSLATRLAQIEERLGRIDERGRYTVQQIDALRIVKPRKAGKRPAPKAKVTHKTR